jgi:hypothetical protein
MMRSRLAGSAAVLAEERKGDAVFREYLAHRRLVGGSLGVIGCLARFARLSP